MGNEEKLKMKTKPLHREESFEVNGGRTLLQRTVRLKSCSLLSMVTLLSSSRPTHRIFSKSPLAIKYGSCFFLCYNIFERQIQKAKFIKAKR